MSYKKHENMDVTSVTLLLGIILRSKHTDPIFCLFEFLLFTVVFYLFLLELLTVVCGANTGFMLVMCMPFYTAIMQISREIPRLQTHAEHAFIESVRAAYISVTSVIIHKLDLW